jgi:serine/threonine protein kinase
LLALRAREERCDLVSGRNCRLTETYWNEKQLIVVLVFEPIRGSNELFSLVLNNEEWWQKWVRKQKNLRVLLLAMLHSVHNLHVQDIVHRDIKTENFIVAEGNDGADIVVEPIDFGFASDLVPFPQLRDLQLQCLEERIGTRGYLDPWLPVNGVCATREQLIKGDIFALGIAMFVTIFRCNFETVLPSKKWSDDAVRLFLSDDLQLFKLNDEMDNGPFGKIVHKMLVPPERRATSILELIDVLSY